MIERLVEAREASLASLYFRLLLFLLRLWRTPGLTSDPVLVASAVAATYAQVDAALTRARAIDNAYFVAVAREMGVEYVDGDRDTDPIYTRNADPIDVYSRYIEEFRWQMYGRENAGRDIDLDEADGTAGFDQWWRDIPDSPALPQYLDDEPMWLDGDGLVVEDGATARRLDEAHLAAARRLAGIIDDDLRRAGDDEQRQLMQKKKVWIGYRRVLRPELSKTGSCALCIVAASRVYNVKELKAMHRNCKCTVLPMTAELDPGEELNRADVQDILVAQGENVTVQGFTVDQLRELYDEAGGMTARELREVRVVYYEHGELGPTINLGEPKKGSYWNEQRIEDTKSLWQSTLVWAEAKRALASAAADNATGEKAESYRQAVRRFDDLIARMNSNLQRA